MNKFIKISSSARMLFNSEEAASGSDTDWNIITLTSDTRLKLIGFNGFSEDSELENPQEGSWAIIDASKYSVTGGHGGNGVWSNKHSLLAEYGNYSGWGVSGFLAKYTNGSWSIIPNPTTL